MIQLKLGSIQPLILDIKNQKEKIDFKKEELH